MYPDPDRSQLDIRSFGAGISEPARAIDRGAAAGWNDFRALVEGSPDLVTVIDTTGRIVYDNPAVEEVLGYTQGELAGRSAFELIHRRDYPGAVSLLAELAAGRRVSASLSFRFRRANGGWCTLESRGRVVPQATLALVVVTSREAAGTDRDRATAELELEEARVEVVERLARAAEFRDDATGRHLRRVGEASARVAERLGLSAGEVEVIRRAAPLHDVGKIGIPDAILLKPGPLLPAEEEVMRTHPILGARILAEGRSALVRTAEAIALSHHERWDGRGYPWRLARDEISLPARIVALVDFYDALTHDRPYRAAWDATRVLGLIREESGTRFDPEVVAAFLTGQAVTTEATEDTEVHGRGL